LITFTLLLADEVAGSDEAPTLWGGLAEALSLGLLIACAVTSAALVLRVRANEEGSVALRRDLELIRAQSAGWRLEMATQLRELGAAILRQFEDWGLTAAEQDVGLLLLKGFSHKEIARLRRTSEATIRQQATSLYQKAHLAGRAELSAYFLEDLLAPQAPERPERHRLPTG
jgi:DNA-binding NarL/FixJ family response regulator